MNVRGRRGNIVQTFPSVEYDFIPNDLTVRSGDLIHIQWTGSNTNPNDAGQGRAGTDRNNFVLLDQLNKNYPLLPQEKSSFWNTTFFMGFLHRNNNSNILTNYYSKLKDNQSADFALYLGEFFRLN